MPDDFGAHQRVISSGVVQAWNTNRAGALKVRVMTSSRSDFRSTLVGPGSLSLLAAIGLLLSLQSPDAPVRRVEARGPELAVALDPRRLLLQPAQAELAGPYPPHF